MGRRTRLRNRYRHPYGLQYQKKNRDDDWPRFPIRGTSEERRHCISKWNKLWKKQQDKDKLRALKKLHKKERRERERARKEGRDVDVPMKSERGDENSSRNMAVAVPVVSSSVKPESNSMPFMNPERLAMLSG